jgi:hypothetical protein
MSSRLEKLLKREFPELQDDLKQIIRGLDNKIGRMSYFDSLISFEDFHRRFPEISLRSFQKKIR